MNELSQQPADKTQAVLYEISQALAQLLKTGENRTLFIDKMSLSPQDRQEIRDTLGEGAIRIQLTNTAEPAEWLESGISGVWYGVFYDQRRNPLLETIEVAYYPPIAAAQQEDMIQGAEDLQQRIQERKSSDE